MSYSEAESDHGTWDGRWSLPSSSLQEKLPCVDPDELHECSAANTNGLRWVPTPNERELF